MKIKTFSVFKIIFVTVVLLVIFLGAGSSTYFLSANELTDYIIPPETDFEYTENNDGTITITKYTGSETAITFPAVINDKPVTKIGSGGYYDTVTSTLVMAVIPEGVKTVAEFAFSRELEQNTGSELKSIILPESLERIESCAFECCNQMTTIDIPANVNYIGYDIFSYCDNLASLTVSSDNQFFCSENDVLFDKNKEMLIYYPSAKPDTAYKIPDTVKTIEGNAIMFNNYLTSLEIQEGVTSIGINAFWGMRNMKVVTIPSTVENIEGTFFYDMDDLVVICENGVSDEVKTKVNECKSVMEYEVGADSSVTVTDYKGTVADITIPAEICGHNVTNIKNEVFDSSAEKITVEGNITVNSDITVKNGQTLIIGQGGSLVIENGGTVTNNGTIENNGTLNNSGNVVNAGTLTNNGDISNDGMVSNSGTVNNSENGEIKNDGTISTDENGTMNNEGTVEIPNIEIPENLSAYYGQTLAEIDLPSGFSWDASVDTPVGNAGENTFFINYTSNTVNLNKMPVTIIVSKSGTEMEVKTYKGLVPMTDYFIYGDLITVKVTAEPTKSAVLYSLNAPSENQIAIFCGDKQLTNSQTVTGTELSFDVDTTKIGAGQNINLTAKYIDSENMAGTSKDFTVSIQKRQITVTADNKEITYGENMPELTFALSDGALAGDDTADMLNVKMTAGENQNAGTYVIEITASNNNYDITPVNGELTINKKEISVNGVTAERKIYDGTKDIVITDIIFNGLVNRETLSADDYTVIKAGYSSALYGTTEVIMEVALNATSTASNYVLSGREYITYADKPIEKAETKYTVPTGITATYGELLSGIEIPAVDGDLGIWKWEAEQHIRVGNVGKNTFKATYTPLDMINYDEINNIDVVLTVTPAPLTIASASVENKTYDGTTDATVTNVTFDGLVNGDNLTLGTDFTATAVFDSANAGMGKTINVKVTLGESAANYMLAAFDTPFTLENQTIEKAANPPTIPSGIMNVDFSHETLSHIELPDGWTWSVPGTQLTVGEVVNAEADYTNPDKDNYENIKVTIAITCSNCTHPETRLDGAIEPTCTDKGYTGDTVCTICNEIITQGVKIAATGHTYSDWLTTNGGHYQKCINCTYSTDVAPHSGGTAVCGKRALCGNCGAEYGELMEHSYKLTDSREADCYDKGYKTYTCTKCGDIYTEYIPALEHDYQTTSMIEPTTNRDGTGDTGNTGSTDTPGNTDNTNKDSQAAGTVIENVPKTGDITPIEIYVMLAMAAGLSYLILLFEKRKRGITEQDELRQICGYAPK